MTAFISLSNLEFLMDLLKQSISLESNYKLKHLTARFLHHVLLYFKLWFYTLVFRYLWVYSYPLELHLTAFVDLAEFCILCNALIAV